MLRLYSPCKGSSPRMRGTPVLPLPLRLPVGIIPAYAGNTLGGAFDLILGGDHPRVCGEHMLSATDCTAAAGSSPRMRGTLYRELAVFGARGIIPAYAGNTGLECRNYAVGGDHPRVCGEHSRHVPASFTEPGSSPRMRGTRVGSPFRTVASGIIPAYAGNTTTFYAIALFRRDHPRVCGEHKRLPRTRTIRPGSSPRMRGTQIPAHPDHRWSGIIPAYAGNTLAVFCFRACRRDHPRVCGEHTSRGLRGLRRQGSSPRMRGTPFVKHVFIGIVGIIPAYAGNTALSFGTDGVTGDHPRVCGEHSLRAAANPSLTGSSPRMRGTPADRKRIPPAHGIIPAYAGNTGHISCLPCCQRDHPRVCGEHLRRGWMLAA